MPPPTRYTAERILHAALELTRASGIDAVSARSIAAALGCSTAPVFTHFASMDALNEGLMDAIMTAFRSAIDADVAQQADPLVGASLGWMRFAVEQPLLYEALFLRRHPWHTKWGAIRRQWAERMAESHAYRDLSPTTCFSLIGRLSIALHGLGLELWSGRLPADDLPRLVDEIAMPVVRQAVAHAWHHDLHSRTSGRPTPPSPSHNNTQYPENLHD